MILVVDANILFSALIKSGITRQLLLFSGHDFFMPEYSIYEFKKHMNELKKKTGLDEKELNELVYKLIKYSETRIVSFHKFKNQKLSAERISPDFDDVAYIALALHLACPIWSNDFFLKKQDSVKVISTKELIEQHSGAKI